MRIVHTSDLHLGGKNPKSIDALKAVLRVAESQEAELLTLGGDIFDSPADANTLRA
ncbi:MAG: DNA repair exonuclease, partial [Chloroflexi bacterium]